MARQQHSQEMRLRNNGMEYSICSAGLYLAHCLFEWKQLKKASKADRITFSSILILSALMSFFNLENIPGPISFLHYLFGPLGRILG
ncbi:hypothetical protein EV146_10321 [Mesobacillus foraminis]|uniref:Uncharacterized protein n=1 Tax=Mesobacillus foraminis TaxID=279826 RepID=A0A4V2RDX9_9BACI|nr:hypothetical protein EV146_10321 [Mesobacillus foraminis]